MRRTLARFVLAIAATLVLVLSCYGLARAYLAYEAARAGRMLKELAAVKIGESEPQVLPMLERYGGCRGSLQPYTKVDKTDYECLVEIGPSGHLLHRGSRQHWQVLSHDASNAEQPQPLAQKSHWPPTVECRTGA